MLKIYLHKTAELFESRINDGIDQENKHPAQAAQLASIEYNTSKKKMKMTQDEKDRYENYETFVPKTKIPPFWEERPWDTEDDKMSEEEQFQIICVV